MKLMRNIAVAFSLYSRIPMPQFKWQDQDMKHNLVFLPWIGGVIGGIYLLLIKIFSMVELPLIFRVAFFTLIPLVVTGGFHLDGFMDVEDGLRSYKSKEEKLEILKDPHIGAFAIIGLIKLGLVWLGSMGLILDNLDRGIMVIMAIMFFTVRAMAGITSIIFKHAKKDGMLNMETQKISRIDLISLIAELLISIILMLLVDWVAGLSLIIGILIFTIYYKNLTYKEFGGVTGDTAGFYIVFGEGICLFILAMISLFKLM
ncbi:MAG: adenosylcobinamide-GDP ribazoletransferase [Eubacterium sp.]|nr:adenosylcobinamide-GDP ribazoletransferase [Eubacterium sp.]